MHRSDSRKRIVGPVQRSGRSRRGLRRKWYSYFPVTFHGSLTNRHNWTPQFPLDDDALHRVFPKALSVFLANGKSFLYAKQTEGLKGENKQTKSVFDMQSQLLQIARHKQLKPCNWHQHLCIIKKKKLVLSPYSVASFLYHFKY